MDVGKGSRNGSVNSFTSDVPRSYQPRLRYNHMATLAHLPNGSISAQWQVQHRQNSGYPYGQLMWPGLPSQQHRELLGPRLSPLCFHCVPTPLTGPAPASSTRLLLRYFVPSCNVWDAAVQGVGKWFEGAQGQSVYWAVSNDSGLTWGRTEAVIPSPEGLPLWGPVVFSTVRPATPSLSTFACSQFLEVLGWEVLGLTTFILQCAACPAVWV